MAQSFVGVSCTVNYERDHVDASRLAPYVPDGACVEMATAYQPDSSMLVSIVWRNIEGRCTTEIFTSDGGKTYMTGRNDIWMYSLYATGGAAIRALVIDDYLRGLRAAVA